MIVGVVCVGMLLWRWVGGCVGGCGWVAGGVVVVWGGGGYDGPFGFPPPPLTPKVRNGFQPAPPPLPHGLTSWVVEKNSNNLNYLNFLKN